MTIILGLDPGTTESGWVFYNPRTRAIENKGHTDNEILLSEFQKPQNRFMDEGYDVCACEWMEYLGMPAGESTFQTVFWIGRFFQCAYHYRVSRKDVKLHICNTTRAKDKNIRQAIMDRYPSTGGGKQPQIGTKKQPGPLYGVTSHKMSALAVAITFSETRLKLKKT